VPPKRQKSPLAITPGYGGWAEVKWRAESPQEVVAYVRFESDDRLLLRPVELLVIEPWLRRHRELPLGRIENAVNANALARFDLLEGLPRELPRDDVPQFFLFKSAIAAGMSPRYRLERPTKRNLGDDFYRSVARAYADAVAWGLNPRKTLAADSGTPADTVARWIRKAREKHYLSPAEPGKASGVLTEESERNG